MSVLGAIVLIKLVQLFFKQFILARISNVWLGRVVYSILLLIARSGLKPLHTIGKVSVNASILYTNQEICNKTNLWKFHLISLFLYEKTVKLHSAFLYSF